MDTLYQALSRKYRPHVLADLIGQDVTVKIISNAINSQRIHHAFLFTGTRGVGKTTIARIIALSINCIGADGKATGSVNPCLVCKNCVQILNNTHPDVMEFDAASKTGIDAMREVLESCIYPPIMGLYKVYIIDEVHMLSKAAFNSMLKTLEEPSSYVKFIFATTEIRKVPITILSRCQKFFLRNLSTLEIKNHIMQIASRENINCDDAVYDAIACAADGSVRDALSLLDQVIMLSEGNNIDLVAARDILGLGNMDLVSELFEHIIKGDAVLALTTIQRLADCNMDAMFVIQGIMEIISLSVKLLICNDNKADVFHHRAILEMISRHRSALSIPTLLRMWQIASKSLEECHHISRAMVLEMLCIKLIYCSSLPTPEEILKRAESCT